MLLNLLNSDNYIDVNKTAIQTFGINTAIYTSVLLNVYRKAITKNTLVEGYIKLDRKYMTNTTSLTKEEQVLCDIKLMSLGIIHKNDETDNLIKFDIDNYISVIGNEDPKIIKELKSRVEEDLAKYKANKKDGVVSGISMSLRNFVHYADFELIDAMGKWIDSIVQKFGGKGCTKEMVIKFQNELNNFAKGDFDVAMRVIELATIKAYKECEWAINIYKREQMDKSKTSVRTTTQRRATKDTLSEKTF